MRIPIAGTLLGPRSREPITPEQAEKIHAWWKELGGPSHRLRIDPSPDSHTHFDDAEGIVQVGSDLNPGPGISPNSRLRWRAVLAHELRHLQRHDSGVAHPPGPLDEAITDLEACAYPEVTSAIREELMEDALQRLYLLAREMGNGDAPVV